MARPEISGAKPRSTPVRARRAIGPPTSDDAKAIEPASCADLIDIKTNKAHSIRAPPFQPVYTIREFCTEHKISVAFFYKMKAQPNVYGRPPKEMKVGARRYISYEAAAIWRAERESSDSK